MTGAAPDRRPPGGSAPRIRSVSIPVGGRVVWTRLARPRPWLPAALLAGATVTAVRALNGDDRSSAWVPSLLLVAAVVTWGVRVTGLTLSGLVGVARYRIPLERIVGADVVDVVPLEYGGWGLRLSRRGEIAVVLRGGPGLRVERRGGRPLVVTVDDAATGAGLLRALLERLP